MQYCFFMSCARGQQRGHQCDSHIYMGTILHKGVYASVKNLSVWKGVRVPCYDLCLNKLKEQNIIYC